MITQLYTKKNPKLLCICKQACIAPVPEDERKMQICFSNKRELIGNSNSSRANNELTCCSYLVIKKWPCTYQKLSSNILNTPCIMYWGEQQQCINNNRHQLLPPPPMLLLWWWQKSNNNSFVCSKGWTCVCGLHSQQRRRKNG